MGKKLVDTLLTRKRLELGMTQENVAKEIGCHTSTLAKWEAGGTSYAYADGHSADYIRRLSNLYGVTPKEIEEAISNAYIKAQQGEKTLDASDLRVCMIGALLRPICISKTHMILRIKMVTFLRLRRLMNLRFLKQL